MPGYLLMWYRCSNPDCRKPIPLPSGMSGPNAEDLVDQTRELEPIVLACPNCKCVCSCMPLGTRGVFPEQGLSGDPPAFYEKLWLRCDEPGCKALTRLLLHARTGATKQELRSDAKTMRIVGEVECCFGHPISRVTVV
jgi:hypothetical protein